MKNNIFPLTDELPSLSRAKRDIFSDVLNELKSAGRSVVEFDREVRQGIQNKAIELLNGGKLGPNGELAAPAAQKVKELWDKYDEWKLNLLS